jgi:hypothetical protein
MTRTKAALLSSMIVAAMSLSLAPAAFAGSVGLAMQSAVQAETVHLRTMSEAEKQRADLIKKQQLRAVQKQLELMKSQGPAGETSEGLPGCDVCAEPQP